jgi:hypothetical protein
VGDATLLPCAPDQSRFDGTPATPQPLTLSTPTTHNLGPRVQRSVKLLASAPGHGSRVEGWDLEHGAAAAPPSSPVRSTADTEQLILVPYSCANVRVTKLHW